ncbi:MAG: peptide transporter [candidate division Zixibacteria bacterium]|nr:peptide transporter [candidate division Zixibacteria bacterium]
MALPVLSEEEHRSAPTYEDGFSLRTVIGAVFVGLVMMPGSIYLMLVAGQGLGPAAEWVTIIFFAEIARRALTTLKRQEVFLLYYVAAGLAGGGIFVELIRNQYLVQFPQAIGMGLSDAVPAWAVPALHSPGIEGRALWHAAWLTPVGLLMLRHLLGRLAWFGMSYTLFRLTSDAERLPFPLAPIAAAGATALAETTAKETSWRWPVFSAGTMGGIVFGAVYVGVPALTGIIMTEPLQILPIPFIDLTSNTQNLLPAALTGLSLDLTLALWGMALPFPVVVGSAAAALLTSVFGNTLLYHAGLLPHWRGGMGLIPSKLTTDFDVWMSVGIGMAFAVGGIGVWRAVRSLNAMRERTPAQDGPPPDRKGRGDIPLPVAIGLFLVAMTGFIALCHYLVPEFPVWLLVVFGLLWTPFNSYVSARMTGMAGTPLVFPYLREASIVLSHYTKGVDIWFAPLPLFDFGPGAQLFRELELTRTRITSLIKAELLVFPVAIVCSLFYWGFFWYIEPVPSSVYPYAAKIWPMETTYRCLFMSSTLSGGANWLSEALKPTLIGAGFGGGLLLYGLTAAIGLPPLLFYGMAAGVGAWPHAAIPQLVGALIGRYHFRKRFGETAWQAYVPVLCAGFACGMGLSLMLAVGFVFIARTISALPF